ncbi:MAG: AAA family ATPase [Planctomycetota bacterium]
MYCQHFRLERRPFESCNVRGDRSFYPSEVHRSTQSKIRFAVASRKPVLSLVGDSGIGKSLLIDMLSATLQGSEFIRGQSDSHDSALEPSYLMLHRSGAASSEELAQLDDSIAPVVRILFPQMNAVELMAHIADEFTGQSSPAQTPMRHSLHRIETCLSNNLRDQQHALMIIDDAHLLDAECLQMLSLLLNLCREQTRSESPMTLLLSGNPSLLNHLQSEPSLHRRMAVKCVMQRMTKLQSAAYIQHRLAAVGCAAALFTDAAVESIFQRSGGIPGRINRLADLALMVAYANVEDRVQEQHIEDVHQQLIAA